MRIEKFLKRFNSYSEKIGLIWKGSTYSYTFLSSCIIKNTQLIKSYEIKSGAVVSIEGDFSPNAIGLLFSLIRHKCIIVPINKNTNSNKKFLRELSGVEYSFEINNSDDVSIKKTDNIIENDFYKILRRNNNPGLVLFTSGTSGKPKAAVHNFSSLLKKFKRKSQSLSTLNFLLFDHWGGLNTMFHILSNGGTLITVNDRSPSNVCSLIDEHNIELLPVSPTFLNLLLVSKKYKNYDLSSLKIISYGTEPMPETTLKRLNDIFPDVRFIQTYGLIELGVLSSKSENKHSLWFKVIKDGYDIRVVDGILQIKAESAMLGYLNADSPFTKDGWFITGDQVLQNGEYIKIMGRKSEIINIGGEKVYPQEVENIIQDMKNVVEVTVYGEKNYLIGNILCAKVRLRNDEDRKTFRNRLKIHCKGKIDEYKIPIKILVVNSIQYNERYKKLRDK